MAKTLLTGTLHNVRKLGEGNSNTVYTMSIGERNQFPDKDGEYAGKYGRSFFDMKFFAKTKNEVRFVEETLQKASEEKAIMSVEARLNNARYTDKNGEEVFDLELIVNQINFA